MSQFRENPSHDPFNSFKLYVFQTTDYLPKFFTWAVLIALLVSLSLVLYSAFTSPSPTDWFPCPDYQAPTRSTYKIPDGAHNVSGQNVRPTNISHIVFGIGGSAKTWTHRRRYSELWWQPSITRGYVWLDETPDPNTPWPVMSPPYRVSENSSSQSAVRIARIVSEAFRLGLPDVRWFVMGDDDTVFFTDNLVSVLSKYDHRSMYYVGGNSESVEQNEMHSYEMAFGGGGFAISYPLAAELVKVLDGCMDRYYNFYGSDQRVWACVKEIGVSLTKELGFHQIDVRGDAYGLLAAHPVTPLVTLHHLDSVNPLFPGQTQLESLQTLIQAYRVDPTQTLQLSFCHYRKQKWSVSIAWGYTVQIYLSLLDAKDLAMPMRTFRTWRSWSDGPFTFNTRPVESDPCVQPFIYFLDKVEVVGRDQTMTTYKVNLEKPQKKCGSALMAVQRIVVLASKMDPQELEEGPRRRCCEIGESLKRNTMGIDIRGDAYGLLAAHPVTPLVSLHHLDSVNPLFPGQTQLESLQTLIQLSIQGGPNPNPTAKFLPLPTWRSWSDGPFTFNTRPVESNPCEQPFIYFLDKVEVVGRGQTMTTYKMNLRSNTMRVRIRSCSRCETVST
ncbi:hypothetical protein Vadar_006374 [Vaccinium darrowii]|uniref:Uncharacterized protein n=1 Tax=Vaccinium darrowii TaxID=229202 RepID=A0ACB7YK68_9ERIC|nr:hypothetical protein Vadar_006374 [Vaccinium darrowii]